MNIAIDGPAGAGKSTIAKLVAKELGNIYVDTGAMYRAIGLHVLRSGIDPAETALLEAAADKADVTIRHIGDEQHVILNGEDVNGLIRNEKVSQMASIVSANGAIRRKLVRLQQAMAKETAVVMDGRDIGTVVLPDADVKVYLTASSRVRAERRMKDYLGKGQECPPMEELIREIEERDERDMTREESPLRQAEDAVLIDSSDMTIDEVVGAILKLAGR